MRAPGTGLDSGVDMEAIIAGTAKKIEADGGLKGGQFDDSTLLDNPVEDEVVTTEPETEPAEPITIDTILSATAEKMNNETAGPIKLLDKLDAIADPDANLNYLRHDSVAGVILRTVESADLDPGQKKAALAKLKEVRSKIDQTIEGVKGSTPEEKEAFEAAHAEWQAIYAEIVQALGQTPNGGRTDKQIHNFQENFTLAKDPGRLINPHAMFEEAQGADKLSDVRDRVKEGREFFYQVEGDFAKIQVTEGLFKWTELSAKKKAVEKYIKKLSTSGGVYNHAIYEKLYSIFNGVGSLEEFGSGVKKFNEELRTANQVFDTWNNTLDLIDEKLPRIAEINQAVPIRQMWAVEARQDANAQIDRTIAALEQK